MDCFALREGETAAWWHRLSFNIKTCAFVLDIRHDVVRWFVGKQLRHKERNLQYYFPFITGKSHVGFEMSEWFIPTPGAPTGFSRWVCRLPRHSQEASQRRDELYAIATDLQSVLLVSEPFDFDLAPPQPEERAQLMLIPSLCVLPNHPHGCSFSAWVLSPLRAWLRSLDAEARQTLEHQMVRAMITVDRHIVVGKRLRIRDLKGGPMGYGVRLNEDGTFHIQGAGQCNCLGISGSDYGLEQSPEAGYELLSHNTDSPLNQFVLLAAVATLWGAASM